MKQTITVMLVFLFSSFFAHAEEKTRWELSGTGIVWNIDSNVPHYDHIEMSGKQLSVVLRYGVDEKKGFYLNRSFIWPILRIHPNDTHGHLNKRISLNVPNLVLVNNISLKDEIVEKISLEGLMTVESRFPEHNVKLIRVLYPSVANAAYLEKYTLKNTGDRNVSVELPSIDISYETPAEKGVYGAYCCDVKGSHKGSYVLKQGEELTFYVSFSAGKVNEAKYAGDPEKELSDRKHLVTELWSNLVLKTPDSVLNKMFDFAKLRGAESIFETKAGLMHGPGGEAYYAAIWANDQAEYINPFFPFLGYDTGNKSAMNSFRHFARFMNPEYKAIPSSIIAEGDSFWGVAGDRGDGAMIAYGAARYALASGSKAEAEELWALIEWCLEYCKRQLNEAGVVKSDADELERRFPAGSANLCTSGLYYDALVSAAYLGKSLNKSPEQIDTYWKEAEVLRNNIEKYFGATVEGFATYRYYDGNDILRSWICIPLTVGIFDRSEGTIAALFSPRLWTDDGLLTQAGTNTFWDRSTLYALRGVFASGATEKGLDYLERYSQRRLLGEHVPYAIEAWPEGSQRHLSAESGLYCRIYTEGLFDIRPTGLHSFDICPHLPEKWDNMSLKSIRAFGENFDVDIMRKGKKLGVTIKSKSGFSLKKEINPGDTLSIHFKN